MVSLATYRGKNDITTLLPRVRGDNAGLVAIYREPKTVYIQLWPSVFQRRAPSTASAVEQELGGPIKHGQRISDVSDSLLQALTLAYHEASGSPGSPPQPAATS